MSEAKKSFDALKYLPSAAYYKKRLLGEWVVRSLTCSTKSFVEAADKLPIVVLWRKK